MHYIIYHFIRPLWNLPIKFIFWLFYAVVYIVSFNRRTQYRMNRNAYNSTDTLDKLAMWFRTSYAYKWDGPFGILDHDNSALEFFTDFGDCDDVSTYAMRKIKEFGFPVKKLLIIGKPFYWLHFDVMYEKDGKPYLFNYGHIVEVNDLLKTINQIDTHFYKYMICRW